MALDLNALKASAKKTTMAPKVVNRSRKDVGPNPFLDKTWDQNLQASYDNAEGYEVTVDGAMEKVPARRGKNKGMPIDTLTGEAADVVFLIRQAAEKLQLGASIQTYVGKAPNGKGGFIPVPKGKVLIKYLGQKRKVTKKARAAAAAAAPVASPTPTAPVK